MTNAGLLLWQLLTSRMLRVRGIKPALISLGIRPIGASDRPDLGIRRITSDRYGPWDTRG